jgi:hypothetical protein
MGKMFEDFPGIENHKIKDNRAKIVCKENKTKITFHNPTGKIVEKIKIDGGVIKDDTVKKCDYLISCVDIEIPIPIAIAILVELKGNKVTDAIKQLSATLDNTIIKAAINGYTKYAYAVVAQFPIASTKAQDEEYSFRKKWKDCSLKVVSSHKEHDLITGKAVK